MSQNNRQSTMRVTARRWTPAVVGAALGAMVLAALLAVWLGSSRGSRPAGASASSQVTSRSVSQAQDVANSAAKHDAVASEPDAAVLEADAVDSTAMWQSPTSGGTIDLAYLVSGAQLVLAWRPRDFLAQEEGQRVLDVLGRYGRLARERLPALAGTPLENMEQVLIGLSPGEGGRLEVALVVRTHDAVGEAELVRAWNDPPIESVQGGRLARGADYAYFLPAGQDVQRIVIVPLDRVDELLADAGRAPFLRRELESLLSASDAERHLSVLLVPRFLQTHAQALLTEELELLTGPLDAFFADEVQAALVSLHLDENLFVELRTVADAEHHPLNFAETLRQRVEAAQSAARSWAASQQPGGDGAQLLARWPRMVELLVRYTRLEVDGRQVVLRAYLPSVAAHNIVLATRLALWRRGDASAGTLAAAADVLSAREQLKRKITLRFPRDTLDHALARLAELIEVQIVILGGDLQLEGITKNQSFGLDERDVSAKEVLETILRRASPEGKLVYTVKPATGEAGANEVIYVTTRKAAALRGDPLPPNLQSN